MITWKKLVIIFATFGCIFCLPDCMKSNQTCPLDSSQFVLTPIEQVTDWETCRDLCNDQIECNSFTYYSENGLPFQNMCFLLKGQCQDKDFADCDSCISGRGCDLCSINNVEYSMNENNFITMFPSFNESHCRDSCQKTAACSYYTIYFDTSELAPHNCLLVSKSTEFIACENCRTGPKAYCNFSSECKSNEAVIKTNPPRSYAVISTNGTLRVDTMGCSAKANVMLVGGGGTGGYISTTYNHGGGGSGYINYGTVDIPYSVGFDIEIGEGGVPSYATSTNYSPLNGQSTSISNETGAVLYRAQGGKEGERYTGGDGYSGGGGDKANGGMNGGNGGSTSGYAGGIGSGLDINSVQKLFDSVYIITTPGNPGSPQGSSKDFGGGGGGVQIQKEEDATGPYGQGGDGYYGTEKAERGMVLIEIK